MNGSNGWNFRLAPHGLWVLFLTGMVLLLGPARIRDVLSRVTRIQFSGLRIDLESGLVSAAAARKIEVPRKARKEVAERLRLVKAQMAETRFLWIDDNPEGSVAELRILKARASGSFRSRRVPFSVPP